MYEADELKLLSLPENRIWHDLEGFKESFPNAVGGRGQIEYFFPKNGITKQQKIPEEWGKHIILMPLMSGDKNDGMCEFHKSNGRWWRNFLPFHYDFRANSYLLIPIPKF